jgi:hypothetical protein
MLDLSKVITATELVDELGVAYATATSLLKATGTGVRMGNTTLYEREAVKQLLLERNSKLLAFLDLIEVGEQPTMTEFIVDKWYDENEGL